MKLIHKISLITSILFFTISCVQDDDYSIDNVHDGAITIHCGNSFGCYYSSIYATLGYGMISIFDFNQCGSDDDSDMEDAIRNCFQVQGVLFI